MFVSRLIPRGPTKAHPHALPFHRDFQLPKPIMHSLRISICFVLRLFSLLTRKLVLKVAASMKLFLSVSYHTPLSSELIFSCTLQCFVHIFNLSYTSTGISAYMCLFHRTSPSLRLGIISLDLDHYLPCDKVVKRFW